VLLIRASGSHRRCPASWSSTRAREWTSGCGSSRSSTGTTLTYTDDDLKASVISPNPAGSGTVTTAFQYDGAGRNTVLKQPQQTITVTHHNLDGTVKDSWAPTNGGAVTATDYNADGAPTDVTDALGHISHTEYNSDSTVALASDSTWNQLADDQNITTYGYDFNGNAATVTSPSAWVKDTTNPAGAATKNAYSYDNLLLSTETPNKITLGALTGYRRVDYSYDEAGRRTSTATKLETVAGTTVTDTAGGGGGTQSLSYYPNDRTAVQTGRGGETITTTYEPAGSPTAITDTSSTPNSVLAASYYLDGLTRTVDDGTSSSGGHTTSYAYNGQAQTVSRRDAPDSGTGTTSNATYAYNSASLPASGTEPALSGTAMSWSYDTDGRLVKTTLPAGTGSTVTDRTYNDDDTLLSLKTTAAGAVVTDYGYTYDLLQRILTQAMGTAASATGGGAADGSTYSNTYDAAGRLATFQRGAGTVLAVGYDHDGNRTSYGAATTATYNPDNSLATSNSLTVTVDPQGRVSNDGCTVSGYDGFDRLANTAPNGTVACPLSAGSSSLKFPRFDGHRVFTRRAEARGDGSAGRLVRG
jgi:YD repeat-containing protein